MNTLDHTLHTKLIWIITVIYMGNWIESIGIWFDCLLYHKSTLDVWIGFFLLIFFHLLIVTNHTRSIHENNRPQSEPWKSMHVDYSLWIKSMIVRLNVDSYMRFLVILKYDKQIVWRNIVIKQTTSTCIQF